MPHRSWTRGLAGIRWVLVIVTLTCVIVPLLPTFPSEGFEEHWHAALNQAVAQRLVFGRDLIYTYGPYASIGTYMYHPDTDALMLWGSAWLVAGYSGLLFVIARGTPAYWLWPYLFILAGYWYPRDVLWFTYCLLFSDGAYSVAMRVRTGSDDGLLLIASIPLGLILLIKGSALALVGCSVIASLGLLITAGRRRLAVGVLLLPVLSACVFWAFAGQPLRALPLYLSNMVQLSTGYTQAMAYPGSGIELGLFVIAAAASLAALAADVRRPASSHAILVAAYASFLYVVFKSGFVRTPAILTASTSLVLGCLLVGALRPSTLVRLALLPALLSWGVIDRGNLKSSPGSLLAVFFHTYSRAFEGVMTRAAHDGSYEREFQQRLASIAKKYPVPALDGTADIYSYLQAYLLASHNAWRPRPVFQSYVAFTPGFLRTNAQHLTGDGAPEHVLFRIEPADDHLPSLEDGMSWPLLWSRYTAIGFVGEHLHLKRQHPEPPPPRPTPIYDGVHALGERVPVPAGEEPIFAEIDVRPTAIGRVAEAFFRLPRLAILLTFTDGHTESYRFIPGMGRTPFLISPRVSQNVDFVLARSSPKTLVKSRVNTVQLIGRQSFWSSSIAVRFQSLSFEDPEAWSGFRVFDPVMNGAEGFGVPADAPCDGYIDLVNGEAAGPGRVASGTLSVKGWLAVSAKDGIVADDVFVTLTDPQGNQAVVKARATPRPDVVQTFRQPQMAPPGFDAFIDVTGMRGARTLGVARRYHGVVNACDRLKLPITIE